MDILLGIVAFTAIVLILAALVLGLKRILLPTRAVTISIQGDRTLEDRTGRTLMTALTDAGIDVPGTCGGKGTCGLCRVTVLTGAGDPVPAEFAKISRSDIRAGIRLSCQITLRHDVAIELPASLLKAQTCTARVDRSRTIAPLIKEIVLTLPEDCRLEPEPGAFVEVTAPPYRLSFSEIEIAREHSPQWERMGLRRITSGSARSVTRAYSVANRPADKGVVVLDVRLALPPPGSDFPPGIVSSWLFGLAPGEKVTVRGPFGNFRAQSSQREMVFIGGGVGMAPLRAIITDQLEHVKTRRKISYWYGARSAIDLIYDNEFRNLAKRHENFSWTAALSTPHPEDGWDGATGFIHEVVYEHYLQNHPAPEECEYYLCGPPLMIGAVRAMLDEIGAEPENIFFDDFGT